MENLQKKHPMFAHKAFDFRQLPHEHDKEHMDLTRARLAFLHRIVVDLCDASFGTTGTLRRVELADDVDASIEEAVKTLA